MYAPADLLCSINSTNDIVALCTSDGVIKFYDTLSSNLKLEYASSTHLQATCTCLNWSRNRKKSLSNIRKKLKKVENSIENELVGLDLIAIGTSQGTILLYSITKASLHSQLTDGHIDKVNDICWCPLYRDSLYSCSDDGHVIEWSIVESKLKNKFKASKSPVTAMAIDQNSQYLLTASKTITLWNLENRSKLKTFTGHSNDIFKLKFLDYNLENTQKNIFYFVTAAHNDRVLNLWKFDKTLDTNDNNNSSFASFILNDNPIYVDFEKPLDQEHNLSLYAVTGKGNLCVYKHSINEKLKKPVKPINEIQFETEESLPLNVICCQNQLTNSQNNNSTTNDTDESTNEEQILIAYGTYLAPKFEKLSLKDIKEDKVIFKRKDPYKLIVTLQTQVTKIETPNVPKDVKVILPGYMAPLSNNVVNSKRKATEPSQISLEDRLNAMGIDNDSKQTQIPRADNLLMLLVQGLQSNDSKMLNHTLQHKNDKIISKTIKLLPTNYIVPLFKELSKRLQGHAQSGLGIIKWLKCVLMIHTSFLMSYPDLIDSLGSVYEMMNARTKLFPQLSKLQGKLQLVMSQVSAQTEAIQSVANPDAEALLLYQDSTSEDEQIEDELIPSHSEFDDNLFSDEDDDEDDDEGDDNKSDKDNTKNNNNNNSDDDDDDDDDNDDEDDIKDDEDEEMEEDDIDDEDDSEEDIQMLKPKLNKIKNDLSKQKINKSKKKNVANSDDDEDDDDDDDEEEEDDDNGILNNHLQKNNVGKNNNHENEEIKKKKVEVKKFMKNMNNKKTKNKINT